MAMWVAYSRPMSILCRFFTLEHFSVPKTRGSETIIPNSPPPPPPPVPFRGRKTSPPQSPSKPLQVHLPQHLKVLKEHWPLHHHLHHHQLWVLKEHHPIQYYPHPLHKVLFLDLLDHHLQKVVFLPLLLLDLDLLKDWVWKRVPQNYHLQWSQSVLLYQLTSIQVCERRKHYHLCHLPSWEHFTGTKWMLCLMSQWSGMTWASCWSVCLRF